MTYDVYRTKCLHAIPKPELWRLLLGFLSVVLVVLLWTLGMIWLLARILPFELDRSGTTPSSVLIFLFFIIGMGVGTWLAARFWQTRNLASLTGRGARVLKDFTNAAVLTVAIGGAILLGLVLFSDPLIQQYELADWIVWLPLALPLIALQTGAEELLFRGYLQSQLAARFRHPIVWLMIPALLFGAAHFLPTLPFDVGLTYIAFAALFGVLAGDLTAKTGSIGAAWGFHFGNNSLALLFVATEGSLTGLGLFRSGQIGEALSLSPLILLDLIAILTVWVLIRRLVTV